MSAQNRLVATMLVAATCAFAPAGSAADPIILNANFSLGNTGFSSAHGYVAYPSVESPGLMYPEGIYTVGANPGFVHDRWADFGDHTTGDGLMMIVNGHREADMMVWSTSVTVDPDTQYDFSAWAASVYPRSPSGLAFSINGTAARIAVPPPVRHGPVAGVHSGLVLGELLDRGPVAHQRQHRVEWQRLRPRRHRAEGAPADFRRVHRTRRPGSRARPRAGIDAAAARLGPGRAGGVCEAPESELTLLRPA